MNSFGRIYRLSIFGESHGERVGVVIDGTPAGIPLSAADLEPDLARRRSGARGTTPRKESDIPFIVSGVFDGHTTGAPITIFFNNENTISNDYRNLVAHPRPGHADLVANKKFEGFNDPRGGGHFSGRITLGVVAAGAVAKKIISAYGITISASVISIGQETNSNNFGQLIEEAMANKDSIGGVVECTIKGVPSGLGEPFFDSTESVLSHALFSIPAVRGVEFGDGFASSTERGSKHNDCIIDSHGKTATNHAGGINGGITNGNDIIFRIAIKPTSSIATPQDSYNFADQKVEPLIIKGRHDACIALRVPVIAESMAAIVLADLLAVSRKG